jgi:hypothetical protein
MSDDLSEGQPSKEALEGLAAEESEYDESFDEFADKAEGKKDEDEDAGAGDVGGAKGENEDGDGEAEGEDKGEGEAPAQAKAQAKDTGRRRQEEDDEEFKPLSEEELKSFSDDAKAAYNDLVQRWRSDRGRYNAFQTIVTDRDKTVSRLSQELAAARRAQTQARAPEQRQSEPSQDSNGKQPRKTANRASEFIESDDWKKVKEDYPDLAAPFERIVRGLGAENDQLATALNEFSGQLNGVRQDSAQRTFMDNAQDLNSVVPGWHEWRHMPEFQAWFIKQPEHIQKWGRENATAIVNVDSAADLFKRFETDMEAAGAPLPKPPTQHKPAEGNAEETRQGNQPANGKQSARRQRQLNASRTVTQKGPAPKEGEPEDFDTSFDQFAKAAEKRKAAGLL